MESITMCHTCRRQQTNSRNNRIERCRPQFGWPIARLVVPLTTLLVTCSHLLVTQLAAESHMQRSNSLNTTKWRVADERDDLIKRNEAKIHTTEVHGRQVLAPLLNAGHLNRMYYAPKLDSGWRAAARAGAGVELKRSKWPSSHLLAEGRIALQDLHSPNNRGPVNNLATTRHHRKHNNKYHSNHLSLEPQNLRFGERRRDQDRPHAQAQLERRQDDETSPSFALDQNQFERRLMVTSSSLPSTATSGGWSQPDPRRSYSSPVSKVKIVHTSSLRRNSAARHLYGGNARSNTLRARARASEPMNRKEDSLEGPGLASTESSLSPASSTGSSSGGSRNVSLEMTMGDFDELLDGADDSKQQQQPEELNEISPTVGDLKPVAINKRPTLVQTQSQHSARLLTATGSHPLVTLIRYVPIIMNVPAEHLGAALATPNTANMVQAKPQAPSVVAANNQQSMVGLAAVANHQQENSGRVILASSSDHHLQQQQHLPAGGFGGDTAAGSELAHISGLPSLSAAQIQQALSGATPAGPADLQQLTHGNQPIFARLAYIPLSQSPQVGGHTMPPMGASHMTSKALAAYASKLISMLKPSHLLSSLGNGVGGGGASGPNLAYLNYQHQQHAAGHQQPGGTQQIFLFAPSTETLLAGTSASHAHHAQPSPRPLRQTAGEPTVRPADLMINQASKVHSTKSQQQQQRGRQRQQPPAGQSKEQQQQQQQLRWPLMPQMNGLVCVQGLIGAKQQKQQKETPAQEQVDLNSFDDDYEPKKPHVQQQVATTKGQQRLPVPPSSKSTSGAGSKSSKFGKGPRAPGGKESPIKIMQQKMASKQQEGEYQQQQLQDFSDYSQISQQKLVGSPTEPLRNIYEGERGPASSSSSPRSAEGARSQSSARGNTQPLASPSPATTAPPSAANFQPGDEIQSDARGRSIIPFTIRDKIDAPANRVRIDQQQQQAGGGAAPNSGTNNSPVQYDEPAEGEQPASPSDSGGGSGEQRRSRTTFVSTSPAGARRRVQGGGVDISYRTELGQRDYSLPVLMASSTPHRQRAGSSSPLSPNGLRQREAMDRRDTPPQFVNSPLASFAQYGPRSPAPPPRGLSTSLHEPMGASSSSSSVSTTTTASSPVGSSETTTTSSESVASTPTLTRELTRTSPDSSTASDFEKTPTRDESPGQLVSSVSLTGSASSVSRSLGITPTATERPPTRQSANDTVELIVNSSSSSSSPPSQGEAPITASPLQFVSHQEHLQPGKGDDIRTPTGSSSSQLTSSPVSSPDDSQDSLMEMMSANSFSHDRSLTPVERTVHSYGHISESLQTNPLDLIDLQNSRSSFELPAQLESLSMLHDNENNNNNNNNNHGPPMTQRDKQHGERRSGRHQDEPEPGPRVLRGALDASAPLT